jgi:Tfp pilus assembly protein PilN
MRPVNLLPDHHRRGPRKGAMTGGAYAVLGVLAVMVAMAVVYTLTANQVKSRQAEAAKVGLEADRAEAEAASKASFGNFTQIKETRLASVKQLASGRFDWERLLRELSAIMPAGSWLSEARASTTGSDTSAGGAPTGAAATTAGKPSATLKGCTRRQKDVATLMVRLRQVYLVEDVTLNESAKGEESEATTVTSCGPRYQFDLLVTFKAAAPTGKEAPQGRSTVPAGLGGGS